MKKSLKSIFSLAFIAVSMMVVSCESQTKGDDAEVKDAEKAKEVTGSVINIDTDASSVTFIGYGVGKNHPGVLKIKDGKIMLGEGKVSGGSFTIDMNSLELKQQDENIQTKLKPHLKSEDFFEVQKYPVATFEITKIEPYASSAGDTSVVSGANYMVSGNLTLKDVIKNITFPAKIEVSENAITSEANFNIDRNEWGITYRSDKSLGDKFINELVNISLDIKGQ